MIGFEGSHFKAARDGLGARLLAAVLVMTVPEWADAGTYIGSLGSNSTLGNQDYILHPRGYDASGAPVTIDLCIVPGSPNAAQMVTPVANIANKMSALKGRVGNLSTNAGGDAVPPSQYDFESVALHEVGHCLGLGHVNAASESNLPLVDREYTKASKGADSTFDLGIGADGLRGSSDDQRDDDVSVHWFRQGTNDPCADPGTSTFDTTTYTVDGALPGGDSFTVNAEKSVCAALGSANTEAVMQQGSPNGQAQRFLGHDGVAMLRLAMAGVDEIQGTADDYQLIVNSLGISDSADCDVNLSFNDAQTGFAVCSVSWFSSPFPGQPDHGVIASSNAYFNASAVTWFFNTSGPTYAVGGAVSGLVGSGLVLRNNGGDDLPVGADGDFEFPTPVDDGAEFEVTVHAQPTSPGQTCTVGNGTGTVLGEAVTDVSVTCEQSTFTVGGSVIGLAGSGLVLQNNGGDNLVVSGNGPFVFDTELTDGAGYDVTVLTQPSAPAQTCAVGNGIGTIAGSSIGDVTITCDGGYFNVGGTVSGLAGDGLVLQNNGGDDLPVEENGSFTFASALPDTSAYAVTVESQPMTPSQTCDVSDGSGTITGASVTDVAVNCVTDTFTVGGTVSGLEGSGLVLLNNGGDALPINAVGAFEFATALADESGYAVTVSIQPADPNQLCDVTLGTGVLSGANVTNVAVDCETVCNVTTVSGVTDTGSVDHEACETLVIGPDYTAEDGADVFWSSGLDIMLAPGTRIEKGATVNAAVCGQSLCEESESPMPDGCHSCVTAICAVDAYCCTTEFDFICLDEVESVCNLACE